MRENSNGIPKMSIWADINIFCPTILRKCGPRRDVVTPAATRWSHETLPDQCKLYIPFSMVPIITFVIVRIRDKISASQVFFYSYFKEACIMTNPNLTWSNYAL